MMNKKLANQAGFGFRDGELYTPVIEHLPITEYMEKFAELIWKEAYEQGYDKGVSDSCEGQGGV